MLVPLTDSTNPYTAMMLQLIADRQVRLSGQLRESTPATTSRRTHGIRARFARLRVRRTRVQAATAV